MIFIFKIGFFLFKSDFFDLNRFFDFLKSIDPNSYKKILFTV